MNKKYLLFTSDDARESGPGWRDFQFSGTEEECLNYLRETRLDLEVIQLVDLDSLKLVKEVWVDDIVSLVEYGILRKNRTEENYDSLLNEFIELIKQTPFDDTN